jgi:Outer membrane protein and related peptidoglycan-associated (lipo)proteins
MKRSAYILTTTLTFASLLMVTGCKSRSTNVWDENKTSANYKGKALRSAWGSEDELASVSDDFIGPNDDEFIPLRNEDLKSQFADGAIPQPKDLGEAGSGLPSYDQFQNPTSQLLSIFKNVFFNTDDHILRGKDYIATIERIAAYLKEHPKTTIIVEGHCDERAPEAYNLALGARRANYIRTLLVQKGVNPDQVHTISYGKERPSDDGHNPKAWAKNRRAQFKVHQKS